MILWEVDAQSYSVILDSTRASLETIKWFLIAAGPAIAAAFAWIVKDSNAWKERAIQIQEKAAEARRVDQEKALEIRLRMHEDNQKAMERLADAIEEMSRKHA